ncbi:hypothetical protein C4K18_0736 [Pseudomonas chlororaphis subsp. aurantiaca]|nr:hypothetical protein C4K18_0736 [Pseudomonas chlororaphis subsp. aurantiaca]
MKDSLSFPDFNMASLMNVPPITAISALHGTAGVAAQAVTDKHPSNKPRRIFMKHLFT